MNKKDITNLERQSVDFSQELYRKLFSHTKKAYQQHNKFVKLANSYLSDGLDKQEVVELLILDGLHRESAEAYTDKALFISSSDDNMGNKYVFKFSDEMGDEYTSYDYNVVLTAESTVDAENKANEWLESQMENSTIDILPQTITEVMSLSDFLA
jgi:hypothetical protein